MAKAKYRMRKNPEIADYVVEVTLAKGEGFETKFNYFTKRVEARAFSKSWPAATRVRVFRMHFTLVSDRKG